MQTNPQRRQDPWIPGKGEGDHEKRHEPVLFQKSSHLTDEMK
jgi:hypothetical protein